jgi:hypothetical protein
MPVSAGSYRIVSSNMVLKFNLINYMHLVYIHHSLCIHAMNPDRILLDIAHVSRRGSSLRVTLPKKVSQQLSIEPRDIVGFYLEGDRIILEKMK